VVESQRVSAFVFRHPYRHFWPLPDEKSVVWSPALGQTTCLEHPELWPWLRRLREIPAQGGAVEPDLEPVARLLLAQGYLSLEPIAPPSSRGTPEGEFSNLFWSGPDADPVPVAPGRYLFGGDGSGQGWCFWVEPGQVCLRCQLRRWQANRDLAGAIAEIRRGLQAWNDPQPAWEPPPADWKDIAQSVQQRRQSLVWSQEGRQFLRALPLPCCSCGLNEPQLGRSCGLNEPQLRPPVAESAPGPDANALGLTGQWQALPPLQVVCEAYFEPPLCHARTGDLETLGGLERGRAQGAGCHQDPTEAFLRARGEALERYCARWKPPEAETSLPTLLWGDFSTAQLRSPDFPYQKQGVQYWCRVTELSSGNCYRAPVQALLLETLPGEKSVYPNLSHGLSCHRTLHQALWGAIWECLERDAVAGFWAQLNSGQKLARARPCQPRGPWPCSLTLRLYEIPCLVGHCRVAWWMEPDGRRAGGSAAGPVPEEVEAKAIWEAYHNYLFLSSRQVRRQSQPPASFLQHLEHYWSRPQEFPQSKIDRLKAPPKPVAAPDELRDLALALKGQGISLFWAELTTQDVKLSGFHVVKVFSPDLLYLPADHAHWPLGRRRYQALCGHARGPRLPHPFG